MFRIHLITCLLVLLHEGVQVCLRDRRLQRVPQLLLAALALDPKRLGVRRDLHQLRAGLDPRVIKSHPR
jgi:hypothetical protein